MEKAVFALLAINALIAAVLFIIISMPADDEDYTAVTENSDNYVPFKIKANKEDLNRVINHYLEKEGLTGAIDYKVLLNDEVDLYGTIPFFSQDLQMKLSFEPEALKNGDVVLQQKSISVGQLKLPVSHVLKLVKDRYNLPEGVTIQPQKERIYVSLQEMKLKSDVKVKVDEFNLKQDDIRFTLLVPVK